jgi:hypothetical protein
MGLRVWRYPKFQQNKIKNAKNDEKLISALSEHLSRGIADDLSAEYHSAQAARCIAG